MSGAPGPAPHRLVLERPVFYGLVVLASLLLSLWAIYLDPVINSDGVSDVRAARYFRDAHWRAGIEMAGQPVYAALAALISRLTGMSAAYSLYILNAACFALLCTGFVALAGSLGGGRRARLLAAGLVLLLPALNGFRSYISSDPGYWAFYVWSLGYFMYYAGDPRSRSPAGWALAALAAMLFALEALVFLLLVPLWLLVHDRAGARGRALKLLVLAIAGAVLVGYALWELEWHSRIPVGQLLLHPLDHLAEAWHELGRVLRFKLEALSGEFLDRYSRGYDNAALVAAVLAMCGAGLLQALGAAYTVVAGYALAVSRQALAGRQRYWWGVFATVAVLLLLVPAVTRLTVTGRDAMIAALTLLAVAPAALERLWNTLPAHGARRCRLPAAGLVLLLVLVAGAGVQGLDLRSREYHLREAGLWLRANVPPETSLYSNSLVLVYYSGLYGYRPWSDYSWQEAMRLVWQDRWRDYDYLALAIGARNAHREGILMRRLDIEPVKTFTSDDGDKVLIFDARG